MARIRTVALVAIAVCGGSCGGGKAEIGFGVYDEAATAPGAASKGVVVVCAVPCPQGGRRLSVLGPPALDRGDIDGARAMIDRAVGAPAVIVRLNAAGQERFRALTRRLAHRGSRVGRPQHAVVVIDDRVVSAPFVDYRINPDGIAQTRGFEISGLSSLREARRLAAKIAP